MQYEYDAVIVGGGPNGLAAGITLIEAGLKVLLIEASNVVGGGTRTAELTIPGFHHDVCSAIQPMLLASPFFEKRDFSEYGLEKIWAPIELAHPLDNGTSAYLYKGLEETIHHLPVEDRIAFEKVYGKIYQDWEKIYTDVLGPISIPKNFFAYTHFGLKSIRSAKSISKQFKNPLTRGLWSGLAGHCMQPLEFMTTAAIGLVLGTVGLKHGWPMIKGGSQQIAHAMSQYFIDRGGEIQTNLTIRHLSQLPSAKAILFDLTPRQVLQIAGEKFSSLYRWQLSKFKYGMGVFKMDFAVDQLIPFKDEKCNQAATIHLGGTFEEVAAGESAIWKGKHPEKPLVLLTQQSAFDPTRAPDGLHTVWAYCHTPHGSHVDMSEVIENQIERFAPGFKKTIIAKKSMNSLDFQAYNANYIGGDIGGGVVNITQLINRPALRFSPYRTSAKGMYICSSSTPPGGGVHGQCGAHAAKQVLRDLFS